MLSIGLDWYLDHELWYHPRSRLCRTFERLSPHASHHGCRPWFWRSCKPYNHFCNHDHRSDWFRPRYHTSICAIARRYWLSLLIRGVVPHLSDHRCWNRRWSPTWVIWDYWEIHSVCLLEIIRLLVLNTHCFRYQGGGCFREKSSVTIWQAFIVEIASSFALA